MHRHSVYAAATVQYGWTPLVEAARLSHTATVQCLVAVGADMNIQTNVSDIILNGAADHSEKFGSSCLLVCTCKHNLVLLMNYT